MPVIRIDAEQTKEGRNKESSWTQQAERFCVSKIAGSNGPAPKLGIPRSTLELKVKQLNIRNYTIQ